MPLLQTSSLCFSFGERELLKDVSFSIDAKTRLALTGANGSGKTTLLRILSGTLDYHSGSLFVDKGVRIGYLPQSGIVHTGRSLAEEAEQAFADGHRLTARLAQIGHAIEENSSRYHAAAGSARADAERELHRLIEDQHEIQEFLQNSGYYERARNIEQILVGLGFSRHDFDRPVEQFSGGWQMRIALAKVLLELPDLLFLDEPTNYLDIEAREWLEAWLSVFPGGVLMVSHDRHFLDKTVDGVAELYLGRLTVYRGNYSAYEIRRREELAAIFHAYKRQQEEIAHLEDFIRRFRYNASKAPMVQSRIRTLEKIVPIEIPEGLKKIHFSFPKPPRSGDRCLSAEGISKSYPGTPVFRSLDLEISRGEKIALAGKNGAGKSSLLRVLAGKDRDFAGTVRYGANVSTAYFAQEAESELDPARTVMETVEDASEPSVYPQLRGLLGAFLFRGDDIYKPVSVLSGGEKNRLALVKMLLAPANLLILDEPTNHLDMASKDVLLDALSKFEGTVIFVSHDHDFIQELAGKVIEVRENPADPEGWREVRTFPGDYEYYRYRTAQEELARSQTEAPAGRRDEGSDPSVPADPVAAGRQPGDDSREDGAGARNEAVTNTPPSAPPDPSPSNPEPPTSVPPEPLSREQQKIRKARIRKLEKEEAELMDAIAALEERKRTLEASLASPEVYSDGERVKNVREAITEVDARIAELAHRWERAAAELAELGKSAETGTDGVQPR